MNSNDFWFAVKLCVTLLYLAAALLFWPDAPLATFILIVALVVWLVLWEAFTEND